MLGIVCAAGCSRRRSVCSWVIRDSPVLLQSQVESETGIVHVVVPGATVVIMYIVVSTATVIVAAGVCEHC